MAGFIQLEGSLKFGLVTASTEYGSAVTSINIALGRNLIEVPATYANSQQSQAAGSRTQEMSITFLADPTAAASFWSELYAAYLTATGELKFEGTQEVGAVSATNPKWAGTIIVTGLDVFGEVGGLRQQTQTYPIKAGTLVRTTA